MSTNLPTTPGLAANMLEIPRSRIGALRSIRARLLSAKRIVLTTHINADGDGAGSEVAVAAWLRRKRIQATIVNPTPFPRQLRFLLEPETVVADWGTPEAADAVRQADLLLVLDTGEPSRIEPIGSFVATDSTLVIDHHPPGSVGLGSERCIDSAAAATGELIYDLLSLESEPWPEAALLGIYVAIVTDTGSFRFSNTNPRTHAIAGDLISRGIDPEWVYQHLYATMPIRRVELLREALGTLRSDPSTGLTWIVVTRALIDRLGATAEDLDGLVEYARAVEGTAVALLFRETPDGRTKVSFRSNGPTDVNRIARRFGGGGHVKASGATLDGAPETAVPRVLQAITGKDEG